MKRRDRSQITCRVSDTCHHTDTPEPALGVNHDHATAMLPADLIQNDETIILLLKPSPIYIVLASLGTLSVIVGLAAIVLWLHLRLGFGAFDSRSMVVLAVVLLALRLFWQFLEWMSRTYVLTDRRVIRIKGVFRIEVFQAELKRLQHTEMIQTVRERLFGLGTISFATAGTAFPEAYWMMLRRPYAVQQKIVQTINRYRCG